ncbi:MAG TPA: cation diffusion facilitator family transporter [Thermomicrobiales bacterium]|nr:cation diffusion facilitator family transporter [Thermomicrobiales bacterium]
MAHAHHHDERANPRPLAIALGITTVFLIVEIIGGLTAESLALLADAGHMATDVAALALSLFAIWLARRPATPRHSFGYLRAEILAAFVNAALLIVVTIFIFWEAIRRLTGPPEVRSGLMLIIAFAGLLANAASAAVLMRGGGHEHNLNTRGAFLHVVGDFLGSAAAIIAALIMLATGWYLADPILSAAIGALILWSAWRLLHESVLVLLEASPADIDVAAVRAALADLRGVAGVHDLHIWTVTSGLYALSGHVEITNDREWHDILLDAAHLLRDRFGIAHITLQPEEPSRLPHSFRGCSLDSPAGLAACQLPPMKPHDHATETPPS